jgi:hypothetical protein
MTESAVLNPYHADYADEEQLASAPFAGRKAAFARLYQQLTDTVRQSALVVLGGRHIGKTALLYAFSAAFSETVVGVYVSLRETALDSETDFILGLAQAATAALFDQGYALSRLTDIEPPGDQPRLWLDTIFLPGAIATIHSPRQLVFLLDDADRLLPAIRGGLLPQDTFDFLHHLMQQHPQMGFALTLDTEFEHDIPAMQPLVSLNEVYRLTNLDEDETRWLLQEPARGCYSVPDDCALLIHNATGGAPALAQQFGYQLFRRWQVYPDLNVVTLEDVKALTIKVYAYGEDDYRYLWSRLTLNERLVLTSMSGLLYNDPLGRIDTSALESWLVETDYPMDVTSINAALRSLEYREIVLASGDGLTLNAGMLQTWLLDNARLNDRATPLKAPSGGVVAPPATWSDDDVPRRRPRLLSLLAIAAIIGIILAAIILVILSNTPVGNIILNPQPTVTLAGGG